MENWNVESKWKKLSLVFRYETIPYAICNSSFEISMVSNQPKNSIQPWFILQRVPHFKKYPTHEPEQYWQIYLTRAQEYFLEAANFPITVHDFDRNFVGTIIHFENQMGIRLKPSIACTITHRVKKHKALTFLLSQSSFLSISSA